MKWTEDLSVGIEKIDAQHRELFNRINDLVEAIRNARCKYTIDDTIKFLEAYAVEHFGEEERYMREFHYPGYVQHSALHRIFLDSLSSLKRQAEEPRIPGSSYDLSVTTNQVVVDWIVSHILTVDKRLGEFLKGRVS